MPTRNVVLTERQEELLETLVKSGRYQNASEVLRDGLRLVEQREAEDAGKLKALRAAARVGVGALDRGDFKEFGNIDAVINNADARVRVRYQFDKALAGIIGADYQGADALHVRWTFRPGRRVELSYQYTRTGPADYMGITFDYPEDKITGMKWRGRGPYRVWKNRLKGQLFGVWHKAYNNTITGESWNYPEFKGYHAEVNWVVVENKESPFTIYMEEGPRYLQMLHPQREKAALTNNNVEPPFPAGAIGILDGISAIGTKFQSADVLGPQSQKYPADGLPVSGKISFDFSH